MTGETQTNGPFGYRWTMFTANLDALEAVQADHPVQPIVASLAIKVNLSSQEVWRANHRPEMLGFRCIPQWRMDRRRLFGSTRHRAGLPASLRKVRSGAVIFIQRFGDSLHLNVHCSSFLLSLGHCRLWSAYPIGLS